MLPHEGTLRGAPSPRKESALSKTSVIAKTKAIMSWSERGIDGFAAQPVGTGPFRLTGWTGTQARFEAVPTSWRAPKVRQLEVNAQSERAARVQAFQSGQIDILIGVPTDAVDAMKGAGATLLVAPGPTVLTWALTQINARADVDVTPFRDPRVRLALNLAIDRDAIAKGLLAGYGQPIGQGVASTVFGHDPSVKPYPHDPGRARTLLAEAGYGRGLRFKAEVREGYFPADLEIYQQVAEDLRKVGVEVEIVVIPFADWVRKFRAVTWDGAAWASGWNAAPPMDAMAAIGNHTCDKGGKPYRCEEREQALVRRIDGEFDREKCRALIHELIRVQHEAAAALFLFEADDIDAVSAKLKGVRNVNRYLNYHEMTFAD